MIPFYVKFKRNIDLVNPVKQNQDEILSFISIRLKERKADNIKVQDSSLTFTNSFLKLFGWSWNIMLPIDSGILNVSTRKMNSIVIEYKI